MLLRKPTLSTCPVCRFLILDPLFWEKIKDQGNLEVAAEVDPLIQIEPRVRRAVARLQEAPAEATAETSKDSDFDIISQDALISDGSSDDEKTEEKDLQESKRILSKKQRVGINYNCLTSRFPQNSHDSWCEL